MSKELIQLNDIESLFVVSCKNWETDDNFLSGILLNEYNTLTYEEFVKNNPLDGKNENVKKEAYKKVKYLFEQPVLMKAFYGIYGQSIDFDTYNAMVEIIGDIAFKINPEGFKEAVYKIHGLKNWNNSDDILSELRSAIGHSFINHCKLNNKYLPQKYLNKFENERV